MPSAVDDDKTKNKGRNDDGGDDDLGDDDLGDKPMTAKQVNAAITKAVRGVEKRLSKSVGETLAKALADAGLTKKPPADDDDDEGDDGDDAPAKPVAKPADQPAPRKGKSKAEKELAKLKADMEAMKAQAEAEKAKAQRAELKRAATELLSNVGVRKEAVPLLVTYLMSEDGGRRIRVNDDGQPVFVLGDGDDAEELLLKDGIAAWAKTDEGKAYLAPKQAAGTGGGGQVPGVQPRTVGQLAGTNVQQVQATAQQNRDLFNAVMGEMGGFIIGGDAGAPVGQG